MCILREIGQNFTGGFLHKGISNKKRKWILFTYFTLIDQFKIVYVAPMKALAAEMTASFSSRLSPLGIIVRELTGGIPNLYRYLL